MIEPTPFNLSRVGLEPSSRESIVVQVTGSNLPINVGDYRIESAEDPATPLEIDLALVSSTGKVVVLQLNPREDLASGEHRFRVACSQCRPSSRTLTMIARGSSVVYPGRDWVRTPPEEQGIDSRALRRVPADIGAAIVVRNGYKVWEYRDSFGAGADTRTFWASVARTYMTAVYGVMIRKGLIPGAEASLDRPVNSLDSDVAREFDDDILIWHLLSYTSCSSPPGTMWSYSCNWIPMNEIAKDLVSKATNHSLVLFAREELRRKLGGGWSPRFDNVDGTFRVWGSPSDVARLGYLLQNMGSWKGEQILPRWYVRRALSGSDADRDEGWQIHLNASGHWEDCPRDAFSAIGGNSWDRRFVFVSPSLKLVVARAGEGTDENPGPNVAVDEEWFRNRDRVINRFFGPICRAARRGT